MKTMKTMKAALVLGMIFLFTTAFGQSNEMMTGKIENNKKSVQTHFDIMVNMATTNLNYGEAENNLTDYKKSLRGLQAGFSFQAGVTPSFSLVSELYYMRKGGTLKSNNPLTGNESTIRLNSIELPVLARFHIGRIYLNAGPSMAYNFSGNRKFSEGSTKLEFSGSSDGFKRLDASVQVGGGFAIPSKKKSITVDIRYVHGLSDITNGHDIKTRSLLVSLYFSKLWKTNPLAKKQYQETGF
ncbi:MAG TPA: porin family protein [Bacteroidia bacterium]|nr:porin family protein [Bacteroidia bacterium]